MTTWTYATDALNNVFKGSQYFGNGAILTMILIVFTMLIITRNINSWNKLALPVTIMYVTIIQTINHWAWGALLITVSGTMYATNVIVPNIPRSIGINIREGIQQITGIARIKEIRQLRELKKGMSAPKNYEEIEHRYKTLTSKKFRKEEKKRKEFERGYEKFIEEKKMNLNEPYIKEERKRKKSTYWDTRRK